VDNLIYGEASLYKTEKQGGLHPPDSSASATIKSIAPYWRLAIQFITGEHILKLEHLQHLWKCIPVGISGLTDKYTDVGFDFNYEKPFGDNEFVLHASYIRENRSLAATYNAGGSAGNSPGLNSFK